MLGQDNKVNRILKPQSLGLRVGDVCACVIVDAHVARENGFLYLPVELKIGGEMLLNKSRIKNLVEVLGCDSDLWVGSWFQVEVVRVLNPETREMVLSWDLKADSVGARGV